MAYSTVTTPAEKYENHEMVAKASEQARVG